MSLLRLIRRLRPSPGPVLTEAEVSAAVRRIQTLEPLCDAEAIITNDGFGASVSFRTTTHQSALGCGSIEIGLRTAALEIQAPEDATGWSWSDAVPLLVKAHRSSETQQEGGSTRAAHTKVAGAEHHLDGDAGVNGGVFRAGLKAAHRETQRRDDLREDQTTWNRTRTVPSDLVGMEGVRRRFTLRLTAPNETNLGYFNADLVRQSFLSVPEPSSLDLATVKVFLTPPVIKEWGDELIHSLSIAGASGAWAPLAQTRNKQIVGELLLSKFLRPLHRRTRLWPRRTGPKA